jgi:hypothetical protein
MLCGGLNGVPTAGSIAIIQRSEEAAVKYIIYGVIQSG